MCALGCALISAPVAASAQCARDAPDGLAINQCAGDERVSVALVGDLLLHGPLQRRAYASDDGFLSIWGGVLPLLQDADITYANLEGPVAEGVSRSFRAGTDPGRVFDNRVYTSYPLFNYHQSLLDDLIRSGIDVVSTANNHALDRGGLGADRTIEALRARGIAFTGTVQRDAVRRFSTVTPSRLGDVAWLACTYGTNGINDRDDQVLWCFADRAELLAEVSRLSRDPATAAVFVTPHWGVEYQTRAGAQQRVLARELAEAGATAIIGAHPHVLQQMEVIDTTDGRKVPVLYSLGNFVSNQRTLAQRTSVVAELDLCMGRQPLALETAFLSPSLVAAGLRYTPTLMDFSRGPVLLLNSRENRVSTASANLATSILPASAETGQAGACDEKLGTILTAFDLVGGLQ